jgi:transposase InsO family protein
MNFVTGLPSSNSFHVIWVVVDCVSKLRHFAPYSTVIEAEGLAKPFLSNIFRLHVLPDTIVSDQGPQFTLCFWKYLCNSLKIEPRLSTTSHPQRDGKTERTNAMMEQYLPAYVNYQQDDWVEFLPMEEFAANNHILETTGISPLFTNYGLNPKSHFQPDI